MPDDSKLETIPVGSLGIIAHKSCQEHYVLNQLRKDSAFVPELDYSLQKAAELGCGALCFEGNIDFYGKSGFRPASEFGIRYHGLDEGEDASFFLCKELIPLKA